MISVKIFSKICSVTRPGTVVPIPNGAMVLRPSPIGTKRVSSPMLPITIAARVSACSTDGHSERLRVACTAGALVLLRNASLFQGMRG